MNTNPMKAILLFAFVSTIAFAASDAETLAQAQITAKNFLTSFDAGNVGGVSEHVYQVDRRKQPNRGTTKKVPIVELNRQIEDRKQWGRLLERKLVETKVSPTWPRTLPDGQYVRFTYQARYEKKTEPVRDILTIKADNPQRFSVVAFSQQ